MYFLNTDVNKDFSYEISDTSLPDFITELLATMVFQPESDIILFKPQAPFDNFQHGIYFLNRHPKTQILLFDKHTMTYREVSLQRYHCFVEYCKTNNNSHILYIGTHPTVVQIFDKFIDRFIDLKNNNETEFTGLTAPTISILKCPATCKLFAIPTYQYDPSILHLSNPALKDMGLYSTDPEFTKIFIKNQHLVTLTADINYQRSHRNTMFVPDQKWKRAMSDDVYFTNYTNEYKKHPLLPFREQVLHSDYNSVAITPLDATFIEVDDRSLVSPILSPGEMVLIYDVASLHTSTVMEMYKKTDDSVKLMACNNS